MTAKRAYEIFYTLCGKDCGWPAQWDDAAPAAQQAFQGIVDEAGTPSGGGQHSDLEAGEYPNARVLPGWTFDTFTYDGKEKVKLLAAVDLPLSDGTSAVCRFEWIIDDLTNKDGTAPSAGFKAIMAAGVTEADLRAWTQGGQLAGLDRNKVTAVVAPDKGGYLKVKYLNAPGSLIVKTPPTRTQMAQVGADMLATLQRLKGGK